MKIAHIIWSFNTGGAETMLIDILNEQVKMHHEVSLIIVNDSYQSKLLEKIDTRVKVILIKRKSNSRSPIPVIKLNWLLFKLQAKAVHLHNGSLPAVIMPVVGRRMFLTVHSLHAQLKCPKRLTCLFAISDAVKEDILSRGKFKVMTIPNGINPDTIEKRDNVIFSSAVMKVVQVARLDARNKGQDILIKSVALLNQRGFDKINVDFIGVGDSESMLRNLTYDLGVYAQINFLGLRDRNYIYNHLKDYDLMCHPSRHEGFGLTVAEGMAAKVPVLVPNDGGPYEVIGEGKYGFTFKMESVEDCAAKLEYIYINYRDALAVTEDAYQHICRQYSIKRMVSSYIKSYTDTV